MKTYPRVIDLLKNELNFTKSVNAIVKRTTLTHNTIGNYLEGRAEPTQSSLEKIGKAYGKSVAWLRGDEAPESALHSIPASNGMIPVVGKGQGGSSAFWEDAYPAGQGMNRIHRPHDVNDPKAFALEVSGDSMSPKFEEGDIVVVSPEAQIRNGDYVVVKTDRGEVMIKRIRIKDNLVILESVNPNHETRILDRKEIDFTYRVVWSKMRG